MTGWLLQVLGAGLVVLSLADIFLTVLYARSGTGLISPRLNKGVWQLFRSAAHTLPAYKGTLLAYAGPTLLVLTVALWTTLLVFEFTFIIWPALGSAIQASSSETPTTFSAALYYAGFNLTTLGIGDLVPKTDFYRLLSVLAAAMGFSVLTLSLTFFTSVYSALVRRNAFALRLQHLTAGTADAAELVSRLASGGDLSGSQQVPLTVGQELVNLYEPHHFYPVSHYFRFRETPYALARIALLALDTVTLIRSARRTSLSLAGAFRRRGRAVGRRDATARGGGVILSTPAS